MDYQNIVNNAVNETGTEGEGLSPGRCLMAQQQEPGRHYGMLLSQRARSYWLQEKNAQYMDQ